ncbi:hypothetical protein [Hypericibacter sp.]|uniref:hypothetical protein n=1 Tax=Hypericibacter sp. TaxID=2705401 RepID=UPI003D6CDBC0
MTGIPSKPGRKFKAAAKPSDLDADRVLRDLAQGHCAAAIAALAAVVSDAEAPAGARITAATTLLGWAFGSESGALPGKGLGGRKASHTEQVVRLAWMEPKTRTRGKARKPKKTTGKGKGGQRAP